MNENLLIAILGGGNLLLFIKFLIERWDNRKQTPERLMLKALGSDRLYDLLCQWKHLDKRPASEWAIIEDMYNGYRALGGNGEIKKLFDECKEIETTD